MSVLTEVVLMVSCSRNDKLDFDITNLRFGSGTRVNQSLRKLDTKAAGGLEHFCNLVYAACFNYVSPEEVIEKLTALNWGYYDAVVLIDHENTEGIIIWTNQEMAS